MNSWHPHLHSPFLWAWLQATHLIISSCNTCVTGADTCMRLDVAGADWVGAAHSSSVHVFWTTCSPLCPAGCSQRIPSLWNAQHCLMSVMVFLIGCYACCGLPYKSYRWCLFCMAEQYVFRYVCDISVRIWKSGPQETGRKLRAAPLS